MRQVSFFLVISLLVVFFGCKKVEDKGLGKENNVSKKSTDITLGSKTPVETTSPDNPKYTPIEFMGPPEGTPLVYIPHKVGMTWKYKITLGETEPLAYEEVIWPLPDEKKSMVMAERKRFYAIINKGKKEFSLVIKVKGEAKEQGGLKYPLGVELDIVEDGFGIFDNNKVFWAITPSGGLMAHEVIIHSADAIGAPRGNPLGGWGGKDGYSMRVFFFARSPGTMISMGRTKDSEEAPDSLLFAGIEKVPEENDMLGLHLVRTVSAQEKAEVPGFPDEKAGNLGRGFTEDSWFVKDRGLVRREQKVGGKTSMTWKLVSFSE